MAGSFTLELEVSSEEVELALSEDDVRDTCRGCDFPVSLDFWPPCGFLASCAAVRMDPVRVSSKSIGGETLRLH